MPDIDEMWEAFLDSASRHHIPEDVLQERAMKEREERREVAALIQDLELVPVEPALGNELSEFMCDVWENGC